MLKTVHFKNKNNLIKKPTSNILTDIENIFIRLHIYSYFKTPLLKFIPRVKRVKNITMEENYFWQRAYNTI